jgi:hypothetical protein
VWVVNLFGAGRGGGQWRRGTACTACGAARARRIRAAGAPARWMAAPGPRRWPAGSARRAGRGSLSRQKRSSTRTAAAHCSQSAYRCPLGRGRSRRAPSPFARARLGASYRAWPSTQRAASCSAGARLHRTSGGLVLPRRRRRARSRRRRGFMAAGPRALAVFVIFLAPIHRSHPKPRPHACKGLQSGRRGAWCAAPAWGRLIHNQSMSPPSLLTSPGSDRPSEPPRRFVSRLARRRPSPVLPRRPPSSLPACRPRHRIQSRLGPSRYHLYSKNNSRSPQANSRRHQARRPVRRPQGSTRPRVLQCFNVCLPCPRP